MPTSPTSPTGGLPPPSPYKASGSSKTSNGPTMVGAGGAAAGESTDLWSSILDSVSGKRGVLTKNAIILGTSRTGKSTLVSRLASPTGEAPNEEEQQPAQEGGAGSTSADALDLGLSYSFLDVGDETDEETVARLGIYQLPSPLPPYPSLLPLALSKSTILDSLIVILLDWERPWKFLRDLRSWILVLERTLKETGVTGGWVGAEAMERLESHLRHYTEPSVAGTAATSSASQLVDTETPLPQGVLTDNLGLNLVFVCTKADQINSLERDKDYKEEQFDYIQQTLRAIALKYGAALFFTSHSRPPSFAKLRSYILHRLFSSPSSTTTTSNSLTASTNAPPLNSSSTPSTSRSFPFPYKPNSIDRDQILVPTGWDSWGKIRTLREKFDLEGIGKGWEWDLERERRRVGGENGTEGGEEVDEEGKKVVGALKMYEEVAVDLDGDDQPINLANSRVEAQDEQDFLKTHYETLQKDKEKDPRSAFASSRSNGAGAPGEAGLGMGLGGTSVVGPMGSANLNLPGVERALERDSEDVAARLAKMTRRESQQGRSPSLGTFSSPPLGSTPLMNGATSPNLGGLTSAHLSPSASQSGSASATPGGEGQNQVLASFFQSLLAARTTGPGATGTGTGSGSGGALSPGLGASTNSRTTGSSAMNSRSNSTQNS